MSLKAVALRASAKPSPVETFGKGIGSDNGCDISSPLRIQTQTIQRFRDLSADEQHVIATRFWAKVKKGAGCWLWTGGVCGSGSVRHGQFKAADHRLAHRFGWELAYGPIPHGLQVLHKCDVPRCVRAEHLFLGTQQDNLTDARQKGRLDESLPRTRVLTPAERLAIYYMPDRRGIVVELALRYRVSKTCISLIRRGRFARQSARIA